MSKIAAIQMVSSDDVQANLDSAARLIAQAAGEGADLVLLPENFAVLDGGPLRQYAEVLGAAGLLQDFLIRQSSLHGIILVGGTIPLLSRPSTSTDKAAELIEDGRVRPACLVFDSSGQLIARYDKIHLFDVRVADAQAEYSESLSFEPGEQLVSVQTDVAMLGLSICYDLRFPELYRQLFREGAQLMTVPSAFTKVTGQAHWETLLRARAIENQCYILAANQGGIHNSSRETWGRSMIIDPWGTVLASLDQGEGVVLAELDLDFLVSTRAKMPILEHLKL